MSVHGYLKNATVIKEQVFEVPIFKEDEAQYLKQTNEVFE